MSALPVSEVFSHALRGETCYLTTPGHRRVRLPVEDWRRPTSHSDELLLSLCDGATIDVGCGPGRMTAELAARGHLSLGIDLVGEAIAQSQCRGVAALQRDVYTRVPGEGRWDTALLADGNIGIGGDPGALLDRVRRILRPGGRIVVEVEAPGRPTAVLDARLECPCGHSESFAWAILAIDDLPFLAAEAGLVEVERRSLDGRWAAVLTEACS